MQVAFCSLVFFGFSLTASFSQPIYDRDNVDKAKSYGKTTNGMANLNSVPSLSTL